MAALRARGLTVRALVRPGSPAAARDRLKSLGAVLSEGDVTDEASLKAAMRGAGVVFHCASAGVRATADESERVNLVGTENALSAARASGARRFVHLSTEAVTRGHAARSYVDESFPQPPGFLDFSAQTKALAEDLVVAASGDGIETVVLRPALLWGVDDTVTLPRLGRAVRDGKFWWVNHGRSLIATTYVSNLVDAMISASEAPDAGSKVYYVTDDERVTYREFVTLYLKTVGLSPPGRSAPYQLAYLYAWWCERAQDDPVVIRSEVAQTGLSSHFNVQRARKELDWSPEVSIAEGMKAVTAWARARGADDVLRAEVTPSLTAPAG